MIDPAMTTAGRYAHALADKCEATASWRMEKAEEYPEDRRNARCAHSLRVAALYLRGLDPEASRGLGHFDRLDYEVNAWGRFAPEILTPHEVMSANETLSRFCFDNEGSTSLEPEDVEKLVRDAFHETLVAWRQNIAEGTDQPPGTLVEFFAVHNVPLWNDDGEDD